VFHIATPSIDTLWLGTNKGLSRTTNGGRSWMNFRGLQEFANDGIFALAADHNVIWASTAFDKETSLGTVTTGSGLTYSLDGGMTWIHVDQPVDSNGDSTLLYGSDSIKILPVTVPEQNVTYDMSVFGRTVWIASWASGVRKSTDDGRIWQRILLPPDDRNSISPGDTVAFTFDPRKYRNLLGFSVLADGGVRWKKITRQNQLSGILGNWIISIEEQKIAGKSRIWTTNWRADDPAEEYGVSFTEDGGLTWTNHLEGIKAYDFAFRDSIVYVATDDGIFRSSDNGKSWSAFKTIIDAKTWQRTTSPKVFTVAAQGDSIWIGTGDGLAMTIDNVDHPFGESWQLFRAAQPLESQTSTYAYPNPFSPATEVVRFHYTTGDRNVGVTIQVFDFGMNLVRTIIQNAPRPGTQEQDEIWDGRDEKGNQVSNGVYFYRVKVGDEKPEWGKIIVMQ
jgi:hypothetical protein